MTALATGTRLARAARRRFAGDRGAGSAELVVATPLLMLLILLVIQLGIWAHATHVAQATAEEALAAARVQGGTTAAGQNRASQVLGQIGGTILISPHVTITRTATTVTVTITVGAERVVPLPGLALPVTVTVTGPRRAVRPRFPRVQQFRRAVRRELTSGGASWMSLGPWVRELKR